MASTQTTASILHNFLKADNKEFLQQFVDQMRQFKESNRYNFRQSFIGMIQSIFVDFCNIDSNNKANLIDEIIIAYFDKDIIDLSTDKIVNVRIFMARAFQQFYMKYEQIEIQSQNKALTINIRNQYYEKKAMIEKYLNKRFFKPLQNLKYDPSEMVSEYLRCLNVDEDAEVGSLYTSVRDQHEEVVVDYTDDEVIQVNNIDDKPHQARSFS